MFFLWCYIGLGAPGVQRLGLLDILNPLQLCHCTLTTCAAVTLTVNISRDDGASTMLYTTMVTLNVFVMEMACVVLLGEPLFMSPV